MAHDAASLKVVLPGGSGHLGRLLTAHLVGAGHEVVVLGRGDPPAPRSGARAVRWDGRDPGPWCAELDGADAVINLAGRSVDCRYDKANLERMLSSRVDSTRAVGRAIEAAADPPAVWLQMSTATIYAHTVHGPAHDERDGVIGGREPDVPSYWRYSIHIAEAWERELADARTPRTRKVAMRSAMVMSATPGGPFAALRRLVRCGLGGPVAGGAMSMSWIHGRDFVRAVEHLLGDDTLSGPVNLAAPHPLPQREFTAALRRALRVPIGLPATRAMIELGAVLLRTDPELILKSRKVVPGKLLDAGFTHHFPTWPEAARDLARPHTREPDIEPVTA